MSREGVKRWSKIAGLVVLLSLPWWLPHLLWRLQAAPALRVRVVDYTVPFDNYAEHQGLLWLLNHWKIPGPRGEAWDPARDYIGYDPKDRARPTRLSEAPLEGVDWVYLSDTYGVYEDDLEGIEAQQAHMDFNAPVFAGLSEGDAAALEAHAGRGGGLVVEFNSLCAPTPEAARVRVEALLGIRWTGWVGRLFLDLHDPEDVPRWVPRLFEAQYPGRALPRAPTLLLLDKDARMVLLTAPDHEALAPLITLTPAGEAALGALEPAAYFNWFALIEASPEADIYARLHLPEAAEARLLLEAHGIPARPPFLVVRPEARRAYFAGDFSEVDFDPGWAQMWEIARLQERLYRGNRAPSARGSFWGFYAPALRRILRVD